MKQGQQQRQKIAGDLLVALSRCVHSVSLHRARHAVDALQQKWKQRHMRGAGERGVGLVELSDVIRAVVGRQSDAAQNDFGVGLLQRLNHGRQIFARIGDRDAAQAIIAAKGDDDDGRMQSKNRRQAIDAVLGGVTADARIDDAILKSKCVEIFLQRIGVALAGIGAETSGETITKGDDDRASVRCVRSGGEGLRTFCDWRRFCDRRRFCDLCRCWYV